MANIYWNRPGWSRQGEASRAGPGGGWRGMTEGGGGMRILVHRNGMESCFGAICMVKIRSF